MNEVIIQNEAYYQYLLRFEKKAKNMPGPQKTIQRRTISTALMVLQNMEGISFEQMSPSLYYLIQDLPTTKLARLYESQLELAKANEEKFVFGLHKFYNEAVHIIKKEDLYQPFFEFISATMGHRNTTEHGSVASRVNDAYSNLLIQQLEYMRVPKFDFSMVVGGRTTGGELIMVKDRHPNSDAPTDELTSLAQSGAITSNEELEKAIRMLYEKHGIHGIKSCKDVEIMHMEDRAFSSQLATLLPYINEYTYDILPPQETSMRVSAFNLQRLWVKDACPAESDLKDMLRKRNRTLPSNGVRFEFSTAGNIMKGVYQSVLMREVFYDDQIVMLFRTETDIGTMSGYYIPATGYMAHPLSGIRGNTQIFETTRRLLLVLYASQVTRTGAGYLDPNVFGTFFGDDIAVGFGLDAGIAVTAYGRGGKLRRTDKTEEEVRKLGPRAGSDAYETEPKNIQGFIRKVGEGKTPSREARLLAESLGYDLALDETYVRPFVRNVLRLKRKDG